MYKTLFNHKLIIYADPKTLLISVYKLHFVLLVSKYLGTDKFIVLDLCVDTRFRPKRKVFKLIIFNYYLEGSIYKL